MTEKGKPGIWTVIANAPTHAAAAILFCLMVMTFADVILRSALNNPIESATELTRLFMAIMVFAALNRHRGVFTFQIGVNSIDSRANKGRFQSLRPTRCTAAH